MEFENLTEKLVGGDGVEDFVRKVAAQVKEQSGENLVFRPVAFLMSEQMPLGPAVLQLGSWLVSPIGQQQAMSLIREQVKKLEAFGVLFVVQAEEVLEYDGPNDEEKIVEAIREGKAKTQRMLMFHLDHKWVGSRCWAMKFGKEGLEELEELPDAVPPEEYRFIPSAEKAN